MSTIMNPIEDKIGIVEKGKVVNYFLSQKVMALPEQNGTLLDFSEGVTTNLEAGLGQTFLKIDDTTLILFKIDGVTISAAIGTFDNLTGMVIAGAWYQLFTDVEVGPLSVCRLKNNHIALAFMVKNSSNHWQPTVMTCAYNIGSDLVYTISPAVNVFTTNTGSGSVYIPVAKFSLKHNKLFVTSTSASAYNNTYVSIFDYNDVAGTISMIPYRTGQATAGSYTLLIYNGYYSKEWSSATYYEPHLTEDQELLLAGIYSKQYYGGGILDFEAWDREYQTGEQSNKNQPVTTTAINYMFEDDLVDMGYYGVGIPVSGGS